MNKEMSVTNKNILFYNFQPAHALIRDEMMNAFESVYESNKFIQGGRLHAFESAYAAFNEVKYAVGVSNGLDALFLALKSLDIGTGDEVIVPSNTYIATALAVIHTGAIPIFAEPDYATHNINSTAIASAITARTKAVIPVHLYGQACEMEDIVLVAKKFSIAIIEDNAQAHGATFKNRKTGAWGIVNATSFYPGKNLGGLGDGGAITTNDALLSNKIKMLGNYGSETKYYNDIIGYNMRLDELQAAMLGVKLQYLPEWILQRQQIAAWYNNRLKDIENLVLPYVHPDATHVYHQYVIRTKHREGLAGYLAEKGIGTLIHYPVPPHLQKALRSLNHKAGDFPVAEEMANTCLSLPIWPGLKENDIIYIASTIKQFYEQPTLGFHSSYQL
jgi:dTDP-4-amino-4,6-dideoxygalactose transaminase